jgi:hypothetical protein
MNPPADYLFRMFAVSGGENNPPDEVYFLILLRSDGDYPVQLFAFEPEPREELPASGQRFR